VREVLAQPRASSSGTVLPTVDEPVV